MTDPSDPAREKPTDPAPPHASADRPDGRTADRPADRTDGPDRSNPLRSSRTSGAWTALVVSGIVLVLLVIFIAQNTDDVQVAFLFWEGSAPLAVALLAAAVAGVLITALVGTLRIWQVRRRVRRERR